MRPKRARAASAIALSVCSFATSASSATHAPPACPAMATVSSAEARLLSTAITLAPSCTKRMTVARPLPMPSPGDWPAPITIATLSLRRMRAPSDLLLPLPLYSRYHGRRSGENKPLARRNAMINRRRFGALLAGAAAIPIAPKSARSQQVTGKPVYYSGVGPELTLYEVDVSAAALQKRRTITLPANVQYAWPHPSKRYLYVVSSSGGPSSREPGGNKHVANAFRVDPASGDLTPHGEPLALHSRPIHTSVDASGEFLLIAYNDPSSVTVHRIKGDGTIGEAVSQPDKLDTGIYAHQIRTTPDNRAAILVTRGNNAAGGKPEDPGAL